MTPQQANELLPCAHCAGEATLINMNASTSWQYWMAACGCGIQYEGPTAEDCTEMWNRRAPAPTSEPGARDLIAGGALRQYRHNDGSEGFVFGYDKEITDRLLATPASPAVPTAQQHAALQELVDLAQELDMGYGPAAVPAVPDAPLAQPFAWVTSNLKHIMFADRFENQGSPATAGMLPLYFGAPLVAQASPWISVDDRLPPRYEDVIVWPSPTEYVMTASYGIDRTGNLGWTYSEYVTAFGIEHHIMSYSPTHWMPFTAPKASPLVEDAQRIVAGKVEAQ